MKSLVGNGETLGLTLLSAEAAFAEFSAVNPSFFTISRFGIREGTAADIQDIRNGLWIGAGITGVMALALALVFGRKGYVPAIVHAAVGGGMALLYNQTLASEGF